MKGVVGFLREYREPLFVFLWVVVAVLAFTGLIEVGFHATGFDGPAQAHVHELNVRAGVSYGVTQGINAVISVIQKSSLSVVVGDIALGEVLDPVDDIIEQLATMLLWSTISLSIQNFVYSVGRMVALRWILGCIALGEIGRWAIRWYRGRPAEGAPKRRTVYGKAITAAAAAILFLRFSVPLVAYVSMGTESLLLTKYEGAVAALETGRQEVQDGLEDIDRQLYGMLPGADGETPEEGPAPDLWKRISDGIRRLGQMISQSFSPGGAVQLWDQIRDSAERLMDVLRGSVAHAIDIIIVFAIQTLFLPLAMLWAMGALFRHIVS